MKTAILLSGIGRAIDFTFENLRDNLINCWEDRDVYVYIGKSDKSDRAAELFNTLDNCQVNIMDEEPIDDTGLTFHGSLFVNKPQTSPQTQLQMYRSRLRACDMMNDSGKKYDRVISSRMDVTYTNPANESIEGLDMSKLWIPDWAHWLNGYPDRFAVSNQKFITTYCEMTNHVQEYAPNLPGGIVHTEQLVRHHLDKQVGTKNIKTFFIEFHRVRGNGWVHQEEMPNPPARRYM